MNAYILKKPVFSEKAYALSKEKVYTFEVDPKATKGQIREAVEQTFGVEVLSIQTVKIKGKLHKTGKKRVARLGVGKKKAMVSIRKDQEIEVFAIEQ